MAAWDRYMGVVARLLPAGALGAAMLLGTPATGKAASPGAGTTGRTAGVADQLEAIRQAVLVTIETPGATRGIDPNIRLAWGNRWANIGWGGGRGWGNPGWGRPAWGNFRPQWNNWRNAWRNW